MSAAPVPPCATPQVPTPWDKSKRIRSGIVTLIGVAATIASFAGNFNPWIKVGALALTGIAAALNQFWGLTATGPVQFTKPETK